MTLHITPSPRCQHDTRNDAERAIEVYCLPGNPARFYEIVEVRTGLPQVPVRFAVKAYRVSGGFEGYCYHSEASQ